MAPASGRASVLLFGTGTTPGVLTEVIQSGTCWTSHVRGRLTQNRDSTLDSVTLSQTETTVSHRGPGCETPWCWPQARPSARRLWLEFLHPQCQAGRMYLRQHPVRLPTGSRLHWAEPTEVGGRGGRRQGPSSSGRQIPQRGRCQRRISAAREGPRLGQSHRARMR